MAKNILLSIIAFFALYAGLVIVYDRNVINYGCSLSDQYSHIDRILLLDFSRKSYMDRQDKSEQKEFLKEAFKLHNSKLLPDTDSTYLIYTDSKDDALMLAAIAQSLCQKKLEVFTSAAIILLPDSIQLHKINCAKN